MLVALSVNRAHNLDTRYSVAYKVVRKLKDKTISLSSKESTGPDLFSSEEFTTIRFAWKLEFS